VIPEFDPSEAFNARTSDPDTSHQGVKRIRHSDKASVLGLFQTAGIRGLTDREVQAACPESSLSRLESWRKRRSDLAREGELVDTAERRGGQIVWRCYAADRLF
jgi:hypothetical protein